MRMFTSSKMQVLLIVLLVGSAHGAVVSLAQEQSKKNVAVGGTEDKKKESAVAARDTPTAEAARENERAEHRALFLRSSRVEATQESIGEALLLADARGDVATQVNAALNLIALGDPTEKYTSYVLLCYIRNPQNWTVRSTCVRALLRNNEAHGVLLARTLISTADAPLEAKLLSATHLLKSGKLDGYSVLRSGLESDSVVERRLAADLANGFKNFNGQTDPNSGQKIDVDQLLSAIESRSQIEKK
jgi:hypothetical protein